VCHFSQCRSHAHVRPCPSSACKVVFHTLQAHLVSAHISPEVSKVFKFFLIFFFLHLCLGHHPTERFVPCLSQALVPCDDHSPPNLMSTSLTADVHSQVHITKCSPCYLVHCQQRLCLPSPSSHRNFLQLHCTNPSIKLNYRQDSLTSYEILEDGASQAKLPVQSCSNCGQSRLQVTQVLSSNGTTEILEPRKQHGQIYTREEVRKVSGGLQLNAETEMCLLRQRCNTVQ